MVCSGCGRRVDPNRSFCQKCGSSVFVDGPRIDQLVAAAPARRRQPRLRSIEQSKPRIATGSAPLGCLSSLVRFAIFVGIVWYVGKWLLAIPEVRALVDALVSGALTDAQLHAAATALRDRVLQLVGQ